MLKLRYCDSLEQSNVVRRSFGCVGREPTIGLMPDKHVLEFAMSGRKGEGRCQRNWKERLRSLPAGRAALVPQSPSAWPRTERRWPLLIRRVPTRLQRLSRRLNAPAE